MTWWVYALISAGAASATAILGKIGVEDVPSNLATALRTVVVIVFAWGLVLATGEHRELGAVRSKTLLFLALSGVATGVSWIAYYKALKMAPASHVAPIDKSSLALTILFAGLFLGEKLTWKVIGGAILMVAGALLTAA